MRKTEGENRKKEFLTRRGFHYVRTKCRACGVCAYQPSYWLPFCCNHFSPIFSLSLRYVCWMSTFLKKARKVNWLFSPALLCFIFFIVSYENCRRISDGRKKAVEREQRSRMRCFENIISFVYGHPGVTEIQIAKNVLRSHFICEHVILLNRKLCQLGYSVNNFYEDTYFGVCKISFSNFLVKYYFYFRIQGRTIGISSFFLFWSTCLRDLSHFDGRGFSH